MGNPATGNQLLVGLAHETRWNDSGSAPLTWYRAVLPLAADFTRPVVPTGEVNPSGDLQRGVPGSVQGPVDFAVSASDTLLVPFYHHLFRSTVKTELEAASVWQYEHERDVDGAETSFRGLVSIPPVDRWHVVGVKLGSMAHQIGPAAVVQARMAGFIGHGTRIGRAVADGANLGTFSGPQIRGIMVDPSLGDIHVRVTSLGPPVKFKVEVTIGAAVFAGAENDVAAGADGFGAWQNLVDEADADIGLWDIDGNRDPVEILWPGDAAAHAAIAVLDTWVFPAPKTWSDPLPTYGAGQRFTAAHLTTAWRKQGATVWRQLDSQAANVVLSSPVVADFGPGSKYATAIDRDGEAISTLQVPRKHRDTDFQDLLERNQQLEMRLTLSGEQLGSGNEWRRSIEYSFPGLAFTGAGRPISGPGAVIETLDFRAEGGPNGEAPVKVTVVTDVDWTPPAP